MSKIQLYFENGGCDFAVDGKILEENCSCDRINELFDSYRAKVKVEVYDKSHRGKGYELKIDGEMRACNASSELVEEILKLSPDKVKVHVYGKKKGCDLEYDGDLRAINVRNEVLNELLKQYTFQLVEPNKEESETSEEKELVNGE